MAGIDLVPLLRPMVAEPSSNTGSKYADVYLADVIDSNAEDLNASAAQVWREKAAKYSELVDVGDRKMGTLYKNAMEQVRYYDGQVAAAVTVVANSSSPTTRPIERV
jgi:hypothetical protein